MSTPGLNPGQFVPTNEIRTRFYLAMSDMYRQEVPLYGDLLDIVDSVNARALAADPVLEADLRRRDEFDRLGQERHGAVRLGTAAELSMLRRVFAVMGMYPVGYYDLSVAGVPVHSCAFRPVTLGALNANPFRVFTSLLRLELIDDTDLRAEASHLLSQRSIFLPEVVDLVERSERAGGLSEPAATEFLDAVLETFRWHSDTVVDADTYNRLHDVHRLVADITCFRGPHINHLTPRTLDIDAAQAEMLARGMQAKDVIEGPPRREVPILLRQTSFKALEERVRFSGGDGPEGTHTARFGEIEQRGLALTRAGRTLYDELLGAARGADGSLSPDYDDRLDAEFQRFPDDLDTLRREGLAYFRYSWVEPTARPAGATDLEELLRCGHVEASPVVYEDFLPVSAAGVFQSNLGGTEQRAYSASAAQASFEAALGAPVADPFDLYAAIERDSKAALRGAG